MKKTKQFQLLLTSLVMAGILSGCGDKSGPESVQDVPSSTDAIIKGQMISADLSERPQVGQSMAFTTEVFKTFNNCLYKNERLTRTVVGVDGDTVILEEVKELFNYRYIGNCGPATPFRGAKKVDASKYYKMKDVINFFVNSWRNGTGKEEDCVIETEQVGHIFKVKATGYCQSNNIENSSGNRNEVRNFAFNVKFPWLMPVLLKESGFGAYNWRAEAHPAPLLWQTNGEKFSFESNIISEGKVQSTENGLAALKKHLEGKVFESAEGKEFALRSDEYVSNYFKKEYLNLFFTRGCKIFKYKRLGDVVYNEESKDYVISKVEEHAVEIGGDHENGRTDEDCQKILKEKVGAKAKALESLLVINFSGVWDTVIYRQDLYSGLTRETEYPVRYDQK